MTGRAPIGRPGLGTRGALVLLAIVALVVLWIAVRRDEAPVGAEPTAASVLDAVPAGAVAVVQVDVAGLRKTALGASLFNKQGRAIAGLGDVTTICGGDPMTAVTELAVVLPEGSETGFGLFARGNFDAEEFMRCAEKIVADRRGKPVRVSDGRFMVLHDATLTSDAAKLAVADDGPLLLAPPGYLSEALAVAQNRAASIAGDMQHRWLRDHISAGHIVVTAVMTPLHRKQLVELLEEEGKKDSPLLALTSAALSLHVGPELVLHGLVRCDSAKGCERAAQHFENIVRGFAGSLKARLTGLSPVLHRLRVELDGTCFHVRLQAPEQLVWKLLTLWTSTRQPPPPSREALPLKDAPGIPADAGVRIDAKDAGH